MPEPARIPAVKALEVLDFAFRVSIDRKLFGQFAGVALGREHGTDTGTTLRLGATGSPGYRAQCFLQP